MKIVSNDFLRDSVKINPNLKIEKIETSKEKFCESELLEQFPMNGSTFNSPEYWMYLVAHLSQTRISNVIKKVFQSEAKCMTEVRFWIKKEADMVFIKAWSYCVFEKEKENMDER